MKIFKVSAALVLAGSLLAACGSANTALSTPTTHVGKAASVTKSNGTSASTTSSGTRRGLPGTYGTIASVNASLLEVQNPTTGQTTVTLSPSTVLTKTIAATASQVVQGVCISAIGTPTSSSTSSSTLIGRPVSARTVAISQPTNGKCTPAGGFGGLKRASRRGSASATLSNGSSSTKGFPGRANFATASGLVTSISNGIVEVNRVNRKTGATTSIAVTLTSSTTYTQLTTATTSDLVVGQCARAVGTMNSIGAVAATRILISAPAANGCVATGRFGFGGGAPGGNVG
ncbi:hypothetical protein [Acidithrix ferrooxidans]|uniref:DUF5666 domain-containing protein n=1 Tax=Acidithrix ferrooxidans TaxID=1280514 RepID=A0A0D8HD47_9ACTN|nr:hypothetical protein [Acidithrix ferrooxidans]KJF15838.1 hypothetical protein AXFE_33210 [Acidithrix ferrooxidans]